MSWHLEETPACCLATFLLSEQITEPLLGRQRFLKTPRTALSVFER